MKSGLIRIALLVLLSGAAASASAVSYSSNGSCVEAAYIVPPGISLLHVTAVGKQGDKGTSDNQGSHFGVGGDGGPGSKVVASVPVMPGQTLYVNVADAYDPFADNENLAKGGGGGPGGATDAGPVNLGNAGGAASWVSTNANPVVNGVCAPNKFNLLVVAAGGGGGGGAASFSSGGAGGTETLSGGRGGDGGQNHSGDGAGGSGATASAGGAGGAGGHDSGCTSGYLGETGVQLRGGFGGAGASDPSQGHPCQGQFSASGSGGGAGGGYFGGGGGGGGSDRSTTSAAAGGGGGAGSSYIKPGFATLDQPVSEACSSLCRNIDPAVVIITPYDTAPAFVTGNAFTFTVGTPVNVTLQASGYPAPSVGINGLPSNVFQHDNGDGTTTLSGTPTTAGVVNGTFTATNTDGGGGVHSANQSITFTVNGPAHFTNPSLTFNGFSVGTQQHFDVACYGAWPQPTLTTPDPLPPGVTLVDNHNCTGSFTGTPTQGGVFDVVLHAINSSGDVTQAIHLEALPIPVTLTIGSTANPSAPGQSVTFTAQITPAPNNNPYVLFKIDGVQLAFVSANGSGLATAPAVDSLSAGSHTITAISNAGQYASGSGTFNQQVSVTTGPASGTTLSATPAINAVYFASGRVYNRTFGDVDTGIDASGGSGLAIDASGNIYTFANTGGYARVRKTAPNGSFQYIGQQLTHGAYGIGVDGAGNVFAAEGDRITRIKPDGTFSYVLSGGSYYLGSLAADTAGNVFFVNFTGSDSEVLEIFPPYSSAPLKVARGLNQAAGLAVDAADNLFVVEYGTSKVYKIPLSTGVKTAVVNGFAAYAIGIDAAGTLYLGAGAAIYQVPPPYSAAPLQIDSGRTPSGIAARQLPSATLGQSVTLTATVISAAAGAYPSGSVAFKEGASTLGVGTLNGAGTASFVTSSLPIGTHTITANYAGNASFPASTGTLNVVVTPLPVPVTVSATRVHGSGTVNFNYVVGALPSGITGVTGTLSGCTSSTSPGTSIGTYNGTIFGCTGLTPTGPSASSYAVNYIDAGITITVQPLPINVVGKTVVNSGVVTFTWTTPITLPPGTTITGTLSGCVSSLASNTPIGTYNNTISGCTGLTVTGPAAADYTRIYVDAGVNVVPPFIAVTITATKPFGGGVSPTFSYTVPASLPTGVTTVSGTLINCVSSVVPTTAAGTYAPPTFNTTGCSGLAAQGPQGPNYTISYVDGGITVTPRGIAVQVYGSQLPGGAPVFRFSIAGGFPRDVSSYGNNITGCTTTVTAGAAAGVYSNTISGCGGLGVLTNDGVTYAITYVDAGFTVGPGNTNSAISATPVASPDLFITTRQFRHAVLQVSPYTQAPVSLAGLFSVTGSAFDSYGNLVCTDFNNLYLFDPAGNLRRTIAMAPTILSNIAIDSHDNIFGVVTDGNTRSSIYRWDFPYTGAPTLVLAGFGGVSPLTFDSSDRLFINDQFGRYATILEPPYTGPALIVAQSVFASGGVAVDNADNLYVGMSGNGPGTSSHTDRYVAPYNAAAINYSGNVASSQNGPGTLAADRQGVLWGTDGGGLFKIPSQGVFTRLNNDSEFNQAIQVAQSNPPATIAIGASVPVTVTVGSIAGGTPSGTARVFEGATQLASGALSAGKVTFSISGLTEGTHFLTASYLGAAGTYNTSSSGTQRVVVGRASPTILFTNAPALSFGANSTVTAVATSGLPVTFSTTSPTCSVTPAGVVTGTALGACTITANAAGNATYLAALPTTLTLTVGKGNQTITFGTAPTVVVGGATGTVTATASSSLAVTFSSTNSTCSVTPAGVVTGLSVGPCVVTAAQAGNANYFAAPAATQTVNIGQGAQSIVFDPLPSVTVGTSAIVAATGGATFNPVTFSSASAACTVTAAGLVTGVHAGSCLINAAQTGSTNYAAGSNSTTLTVGQGIQTVSFGAAGSVLVGGNGSVVGTATSGLAVTFASSSANCSVTPGGTVTGLHAGACAIDAAQLGNADYVAAPGVSMTLTVGLGSQAIVFGTAPVVTVNSTGTVTATGGASNSAVTFSTSSTTCSVTPTGTVSGLFGGTCIIDAAQAATADYLAAPSVSQTIVIGQGAQSITFGTAPGVEVLGTGTVTATATSGLGVTFSTASAICSVTPTGLVSGIRAGPCVVDAVQAGDANYLPAPAAAQTVTITLAVHSIDLAIAIDDGTNGGHEIVGGAQANYSIPVTNLSATDSHNAIVTDTLPSSLLNATWTCEIPGTATCTASGSGNIDAIASIPAGQSVVFHLTATVQSFPEQPVINTVSVATGVTEADSATANNTASVTSTMGVFADGFESIVGSQPLDIAVTAGAAKTEALEVDLSGVAVAEQPVLVATIHDSASGRMATVYLRALQGRVEVRLSWHADDGQWRPGAWYVLRDPAQLVLVWSSETGASGDAVLAEVVIAAGAAILDRAGGG